jgi:phosphoribosylanthranilate isomerase
VLSPRVKICGLTRREDAEAAAAVGAHFAGVILAPGGPRSLTGERAAAVLRDLPLRRVGVFVNAGRAEAERLAGLAGLDVVQLHGDETPEDAALLRTGGRWTVWKALRPRSGEEFAAEVARFAGSVDGLVLDGWSSRARGGTGSSFPWEEVALHRNLVPDSLELVVAGGLHPGNVARAVALLRPAVVDVSSGVEREPGVKDRDRLRGFVAAARGRQEP